MIIMDNVCKTYKVAKRNAGFKAAYDFRFYDSFSLQINAGMQNIFNSFQRDFDMGPDQGYYIRICT